MFNPSQQCSYTGPQALVTWNLMLRVLETLCYLQKTASTKKTGWMRNAEAHFFVGLLYEQEVNSTHPPKVTYREVGLLTTVETRFNRKFTIFMTIFI